MTLLACCCSQILYAVKQNGCSRTASFQCSKCLPNGFKFNALENLVSLNIIEVVHEQPRLMLKSPLTWRHSYHVLFDGQNTYSIRAVHERPQKSISCSPSSQRIDRENEAGYSSQKLKATIDRVVKLY